MSIGTDIRTEVLVAQLRAQRSTADKSVKRPQPSMQTAGSVDRVEISLTANMTVETVNGVLQDSIVEQINKAIQEAGIDLTVAEAYRKGVDVSPEAIAKEIVGFSTGFLDRYKQNHITESDGSKVRGFITLIRGAIRDGFQQARDFLEGITTLDESIEANIDRTFELTQEYLEGFEEEQVAALEDEADIPETKAETAREVE